jgi:hypothetical protein
MVQGAHMSDQHVMVTAANKGHASVTFNSWGFDLGDDRSMVVLQPLPQSTPLPHTLDGGHEATFFMPLDEFEKSLRGNGLTSAQAFVRLGNGKRVLSKKRLTAA